MKLRSLIPGVWCLLMLGMPLAHAGVESCPVDNRHATDPAQLKKIIEYKKSDHELVAGYFRMWRDVASVDNSEQKDLTKPRILRNPENKVALTDIPDCLDMVMVFSGDNYGPGASASLRKALISSYVPTLHKRGTKVIGTIWADKLNTAYEEVDQNKANVNKTRLDKYDLAAQLMIDRYLTPFGFDGLDVDAELSLIENATPYKEVLLALSVKLHALGKLMIFDSNTYHGLFNSVGAKNFDYLLLQSYGSLHEGYFLNYVERGMSPDHILLGFTFYEEKNPGGPSSSDTIYESPGVLAKASNAYLWSQWEPGPVSKGGVFSYALDRDGVDVDDQLSATTFPVSRYLMTVMPAVKHTNTPPVTTPKKTKNESCSSPMFRVMAPAECED